MAAIFIRTLIIYLFLVCGMKLMGKRQIGEMQISELVTAFLLSELAAAPILNVNIPLLHSIIPIFILLSLEIIITFLITKSKFFKLVFDSAPSLLVYRGEIMQSELLRLRVSVEELIAMLRIEGISDISEIEYAILEQNGQLSAFLTSDCKKKGIAHPIICDGCVNKNELIYINKEESWLKDMLRRKNLRLSDIFLYTVDDAGGEQVTLKLKAQRSARRHIKGSKMP